MLLVKCDFSYSCAAADKILTDLRARAVSVRQLSYLLLSPICFGCHGTSVFGLWSPHSTMSLWLSWTHHCGWL